MLQCSVLHKDKSHSPVPDPSKCPFLGVGRAPFSPPGKDGQQRGGATRAGEGGAPLRDTAAGKNKPRTRIVLIHGLRGLPLSRGAPRASVLSI